MAKDWIDIVSALGPTITGVVTVWFAYQIGQRQVESMEKSRKHHYIARYESNYEKLRQARREFEKTGQIDLETLNVIRSAKAEADLFLNKDVQVFIFEILKNAKYVFQRASFEKMETGLEELLKLFGRNDEVDPLAIFYRKQLTA